MRIGHMHTDTGVGTGIEKKIRNRGHCNNLEAWKRLFLSLFFCICLLFASSKASSPRSSFFMMSFSRVPKRNNYLTLAVYSIHDDELQKNQQSECDYDYTIFSDKMDGYFHGEGRKIKAGAASFIQRASFVISSFYTDLLPSSNTPTPFLIRRVVAVIYCITVRSISWPLIYRLVVYFFAISDNVLEIYGTPLDSANWTNKNFKSFAFERNNDSPHRSLPRCGELILSQLKCDQCTLIQPYTAGMRQRLISEVPPSKTRRPNFSSHSNREKREEEE